MISVACIMMQRDEEDLLEPWLLYHGYLFGFENLHVIDNGSTSPTVRTTMDRFSRVGVHFDFGYSAPSDYERKHVIVSEKITSLTRSEGHHFYFPIDCDEFVALFDHRGITLSRQSIMRYLEQLSAISSQRTLRIRAQLFNIPGQSCKFYFEDLPKVFFTSGEVAYLEHGNHHGHLSGAMSEQHVPFTYLHFRNKPFADLLQQARQKLKDRVDVSDLAAILAYRGHGEHLVPYFSMTEGDYLTSFTRKSAFVVPAFHELIDVLGVGPAMARVSGCPAWEESAGEAIELPNGFEGDSYLNANPDVAQSGMHPVVHYHLYGKKERRRLRFAI
jgi:hypothetical protein